jgi:hypothetical protein
MFTLHPRICKLNYYISPEDNLPPEAEALKTKLQHCAKLRQSKVQWKEVTEIVGISTSNYFRLKKLSKLCGFRGLVRRSKRPKKVRTSPMPQAHIDLIFNLRKENPTYGKAKLAIIIKT